MLNPSVKCTESRIDEVVNVHNSTRVRRSRIKKATRHEGLDLYTV